MFPIQPITIHQQQQVTAHTHDYIQRAENLYNRLSKRGLDPVQIVFDLYGRAAGMYKMVRGCRLIRYNPYIFAKYYSENLAITVPHEVAHYIVEQLHGHKRPRPHGPEWQAVMADFGVEASRTASFDLTGIPQRQYKYYAYRCACRSHQIGSRRHRQHISGQASYACRSCGEVLVKATA